MCAVELCCDTGASGETVLRELRASVCRQCRTFAPWLGPPSSTSEDTGSLERKFQVNPLQLLILSPHTAAWLGGRGAQRDTQECRCCCACRGRGWETPSGLPRPNRSPWDQRTRLFSLSTWRPSWGSVEVTLRIFSEGHSQC